MSFQTRKSFVRTNTIIDFLDENREACDCLIDYQTINTVKVQKSMKDIVQIVHLPSEVQSECYEAMRIIIVRKENKNDDFIQQFVYSVAYLKHYFGEYPLDTRAHTQRAAIYARHSWGSVLCSREPRRGIEGGESTVHSLPPPTIPAGPRLELTTFWLWVRLSNH